MKVRLNQIIRATQPKNLSPKTQFDKDGFLNYHYLLSNADKLKGGNIQSPMFYHKDTNICCPAMYFHSNPLKSDRSIKPWTDVLLPDEGLVYYNGDNKTPGLSTAGKRGSGNAKMEMLWEDYKAHDPMVRAKATPIIVFEQVEHNGASFGYRAFRGYGLVTNIDIKQEYQPKSKSVYSNYLFEVILLTVPPEGLDWNWIYDRQNYDLGLDDINRKAPPAWQRWVQKGLSCLEEVRQRIAHYEVSTPKQQIAELLPTHKKILDAVVKQYPSTADKGRFEALAAKVTECYFGEHYKSGWITKHSGDMGVDFIGRLEIVNHKAPTPPGNVLGNTRLLVIGQAKCRSNYRDASKGEVARDIARVAARLKRGNIGVYVTTGTFKDSTQKEVAIDGYPIILINGRQLADLINIILEETGQDIGRFLQDCDAWYETHRSMLPPEYFLQDL